MDEIVDTHYSDVIMGAMASQITKLTIVYSTVSSVTDQRKHQSSASRAIVRGIRRWPVNSPHKGPVTRQMFPSLDDVIMALDDQHRIILHPASGKLYAGVDWVGVSTWADFNDHIWSPRFYGSHARVGRASNFFNQYFDCSTYCLVYGKTVNTSLVHIYINAAYPPLIRWIKLSPFHVISSSWPGMFY